MPSSHLFFGLPIVLLVLYFELSSGFHSAAFFIHLSLGDVAILNANFHFIFLCVLFHVPSCQLRQLCFFLCSRTNPLLQSAVHIIFRFAALIIATFVISATIFCFVVISFFNCMFDNLLFNFFVFSFRLNDEA